MKVQWQVSVAEDRRPFPEVEIGRHDDRGALVEAAEEMERQLTVGLREGEIAELIEDQEVEAAEQVCRAPLSVDTGFGISEEYIRPLHSAAATQIVERAYPLLTRHNFADVHCIMSILREGDYADFTCRGCGRQPGNGRLRWRIE